MILNPDTATWRSPVTQQIERVFPDGYAPLVYRSASPDAATLAKWLTDPVVVSAIEGGTFRPDLGEFARVDVGRAGVVSMLRLRDFAEAQQGRILALASNIGVVSQAEVKAIGTAANALVSSVTRLMKTDPNALAEDIAKSAIFEFLGVFGQFASAAAGAPGVGGWVQFAIVVLGAAEQIVKAVFNAKNGQANLSLRRLPLLSPTDMAGSDDARIMQMRLDMETSRDWTHFMLPSTEGGWTIWEVGEPRPARLGFAMGLGSLDGGPLATGGYGYMPGTSRALGTLYWEMNWGSMRDVAERRTPPTAQWYSAYCNARDRGCGQSPDLFAGGKDCRQCVEIDTIRGTGRGDWSRYANAHTTDVVNPPDWLANWGLQMTALSQQLSVRNLELWCFDFAAILSEWQRLWETFFEWIPIAWGVHDSYAWRAIVSKFAAFALVSREDGQLGGRGTLLDWRVARWGDNPALKGIGGSPETTPGVPPVYSGCPAPPKKCIYGLEDRAMHGQSELTPFLLSDSVLERAIRPTCYHWGSAQLVGYDSLLVTAMWRNQAAHGRPDGSIKNNQAGRAYDEGLRAVLNHKHLLMSVPMHQVADPYVRQLLIDAGALKWQTGGTVHAPIPGKKGEPAPIKSFTSRLDGSPLVATPPPPLRGLMAVDRTVDDDGDEPVSSGGASKAFAAVAALLLGGGAGWAAHKLIGAGQ